MPEMHEKVSLFSPIVLFKRVDLGEIDFFLMKGWKYEHDSFALVADIPPSHPQLI